MSTVTRVSSPINAKEYFRSVVLRGRNVASFKFALAKSVLSLAESGATSASLEELAVPFSQELCSHIGEVDTQSTSPGSRFLDAYHAVETFLDVVGWRARASRPMSTMSLDKRTVLCEKQVLEGIVEPLTTGNMEPLPK